MKKSSKDQKNDTNKPLQEEVRIKNKSLYDNWYQSNRMCTENLVWLMRNHSSAFIMLQFLILHMDKYNVLECSSETWKNAIGISASTVTRGNKVLKEHGFVHIEKEGSSNNIYIVNPEIAWSNKSIKVQYCNFPKNIKINTPKNTGQLSTVKIKTETHRKVKTVRKSIMKKTPPQHYSEFADDDIDDFIPKREDD